MQPLKEHFPSHDEQLARLAKIEGQLRGVRRMIDERRYCVDIVSQIKAVTAALRQVQMGVLEKHIHHCVRESVESKDPAVFERKIEEIVQVLAKLDP